MNQIAEFNWIDIVILSIIGLSCLFGLWRGLVKEVLSLATWIAAIIIARIYSADLAPIYSSYFEGETTRLVAAFAVLFLATLVAGTLVTHILSRLLTFAGLKLTDRLLGGIFGVARGALIVMLIIFLAGNFLSDTLDWQESRLIPYGREAIEWSRIFIDDFTPPANDDGAVFSSGVSSHSITLL